MKLSALILVSSFVIGSQVAMAAQERGGSESVGRAWFHHWRKPNDGNGVVETKKLIEKRTIRACIDIAGDFEVSRETAAALVRKSFEIWGDYRAKKKYATADEYHPIATDLEIEASCSPHTDLVFYFGVETDEVRKHRETYHQPLGFSVQTSFDESRRWSKGFIWIAKAESITKGHIQAVLLHEVGHVLGCGHVHGTIMTPELDILLEQSEKYPAYLSRIDHSRELIRGVGVFYLEGRRELAPSPGALRFLERAIGRAPKGRAKIHLLRSIPSSNGKLFWSDEAGEVQLSADISIVPAIETLGNLVFNDGTKEMSSNGPSSDRNSSAVFHGTVKAFDGTSLPVVLEYNFASDLQGTPYVLTVIEHGVRVEVAKFEVE